MILEVGYRPGMTNTTRLLAGLVCASGMLAACGSATDSPASTTKATSAETGSASADTETGTDAVGGGEKAARSVDPRILLAHDGGLTLVDGATGETVKESEHPGFLRLSNAGDGRHVMVADTDVFRVYDAGISVQQHGDHTHAYTFNPGMTGTTYDAEHAGHVVLHNGLTTLFADGTGEIQVLDSDEVADPAASVEKKKAPAAHHGVAFELSDGALIRTDGDEESRSTVLVEKDGTQIARTTDCPGVHGEAPAQPTATSDVAVFGCENGPVVYRDKAFHKVKVAQPYVRTGNLAGSEHSPFVLSDYKTVEPPKDAEGVVERPTKVALIDSRSATLKTVDLGSSYWFRSLARGPKGEGVVLTYDGALKLVDPASATVTGSVPVIGPWTEKADWEEPGPAVKVAGYRAYVTDAKKKELVVVDLRTKKGERRVQLEHTPYEMAVVTGRPEAPAAAGHDHHDQHDR